VKGSGFKHTNHRQNKSATVSSNFIWHYS